MGRCIRTLKWFNPYTTPPPDIETFDDGRTRWACCVLDRQYEEEIVRDNCPSTVPGEGWCHTWQDVYVPRKGWSPDAKARVRLSRLNKRLEKKFPLFAAMFAQDEINRRPEYFDPKAIAAAAEAMQE